MRVFVVDDERHARQRLTRLLTAMPGIKVAGQASDGVAALEVIPRMQPDVLLLDVQMPGLSGFDVLDALPVGSRPPVVFVTAHDVHAVRAFDISAVDYLVKPVTADRLARALTRVRERNTYQRVTDLLAHLRQSRPMDRIVGRCGHELRVIPMEVVEAFIAERELVFAVTKSGRFLVERTLRELEGVLDARRFVRVHRSTIINLARLEVVEPIVRGGATVRLHSGLTVEVSRRYSPLLRQKLGW